LLTSTLLANGAPAPANGVVILELVGTGVPVSITIQLPGVPSSITASLNTGNSLVNGALYEFAIHVVQGETITVPSTVTLIGMFFMEGI
jgi:hypothetical protein